MNYHYLEQYIASTVHKVTINLIGAGGTGSHMLTNLGVLSHAFQRLGKQPLFVRVFDPDIVEIHNVGRQAFSIGDIGQFKADVLVTRCNRYFGTEWVSIPELYGGPESSLRSDSLGANFIISCVDSIKSRRMIMKQIPRHAGNGTSVHGHYTTMYYWMDLGNSKKTGQILLGTVREIGQPDKKATHSLPCFFEEFPKVRERKEESSCSLAESLGRQDLFINKIMATYASNMLWQLMTEFRISYRGIYINLETLKTQPIDI